jgi:hypothetical protein
MSQKEITVGSIKNFIDIEGLNEADVIVRKQSSNSMSIDEKEEMTYVATISDSSVDMDSDIVYPKGCDSRRILKTPVVLWSHARSSPPVGKILGLTISDNKIEAKVKMAPTDFGKELWTLIKGGYLNTNSIGFIIKNAVIKGSREFNEFVTKTGLAVGEGCNRIITDFILVENSLCSIPSNENALIEAVSSKSIHLDDKLSKELGLKDIEIKDIPPVPAAIPIPVILDAPIIEPKIETPKAPEVVVTPPVIEPKIEVIAPIKPIFTVVREGGYVPSKEDVKSFSDGKIILI